jgi:hypothetical protein
MTRATVDGQFLSSVYLSGNSEMRPALSWLYTKLSFMNVGSITMIIHTLSKLAASFLVSCFLLGSRAGSDYLNSVGFHKLLALELHQ